MKLKRFLALAAVLLCLATALSACASRSPKKGARKATQNDGDVTPNGPLLDAIFVPEFNHSESRMSSMLSIPSLGDIQPSSNQYFSIFKDANTKYIYSNTENKVIQQIDMLKATSEAECQSTNIQVYMETCVIPSAMPNIYAVIRYGAYDENIAYRSDLDAYLPLSSGTYEVTIEFYDTKGVTIHTISSEEVLRNCPDPLNTNFYIESLICTSYGNTNLFSIGNSILSISSYDGNVASLNTYEHSDIPAFTMMSANYYYAFDRSSFSVTVYDAMLEQISTFTLTAELFEEPVIIFPLENGNLLFQRQKLLPSDATKYDLIKTSYQSDVEVTLKYDITTTVIDIQGSKTVTEKPDFVILEHLYSLSTLDKLSNIEYYSKLYNSEIDTIVKIAYIDESKVLSTEPSHTDIVALSNDGTVQCSLILNKGWLSVPMPVKDGIYAVHSTDNDVNIIDRDGNVIFTYDSSENIYFDKLLLGLDAIYLRATGEKVFELSEKHTVIENYYSRAIFIAEATSDGDTLLHVVFANGEVANLGIIDGPGKNIDHFSVGQYGGYYVIKKAGASEYSYFNEYGDPLGMTLTELSYVLKTVDGHILTNTQTGESFHITADEHYLPTLYMSKI